ncbi:phosphotransferase enzyme family protein [Pelagicoccus mobilis]|uniref:Phosphotransferase n=1 Tax=Pelagicoccus mobilis TaxID=415221 RepID=A0A934RV78_9BACT|nr:phosphotransferase [Pelagicoccus mobilis]MBK1878290.1 phosphotransferase [Pelagicoccus mobilis]
MDSNQLSDYSEPFLIEACKLWNLQSPKLISEAENLIFAAEGPDEKVALRLTHPSHRTRELLQAELDWVDRLNQATISVVTPTESINQQLVETIIIGETTWLASATRWIDGHSVKPRSGKVSEESIRNWGSLTGQIVSQSLEMNRSNLMLPRHHWDELIPGQPSIAEQLGSKHAQLAQEVETAKSQIAKLAKTESNYLLAHTDLHSGNVFQTKTGKLVALDFDDACYHYLLQEFAMPIYYSLLYADEDTASTAKHFFTHFLRGYRKFHDIDCDSLYELPLFFHLRDLDLEAICYRWRIDPDSKWTKRVHHIYKNGNPISGLPWKKWAKEI